jgi:hypothetical protein
MAAVEVHINGIDRTEYVLWNSIDLNQTAKTQVDILNLSMNWIPTRPYIPSINDEVELFIDGVKTFGGDVLNINRNISGYNLETYALTVKDYTHRLDKYLVAEVYQGEKVLNIITDILNRYSNRKLSYAIGTFEVDEIWSAGTVDTDNYTVGTRGRKLTSTNGVLAAMERTVSLNLQPTGFSSADFIDIDVFVDNIPGVASCILKLGNDTFTSYFQKNITSDFASSPFTGDMFMVRHAMSSFTTVGSPSWNAITGARIEVVSNSGVTVNITFDNWRVSSVNAFTRFNSKNANVVVNYKAFNYTYVSISFQQLAEFFQWQWYVDENKDIHFYQPLTEAATFNISDTLGNHIPDSLTLTTIGDAIRNSVFVKGGEYEAATETEQLGRQADNANKFFKLAYRYKNYSLTLGGVQLSVGLDNLNDFTLNESQKQDQIGEADIAVGDSSANTKQSQQVITSAFGRRMHVKLFVRKVGAPTDNFQVQLFTDNGSDQPSATAISTIASIAGTSLTTDYQELTFDFTEGSTNSLLLNRDVKYHIVVSRSGAVNGSNYYQLDSGDAGTYGGIAYRYNGSSWVKNGEDLYFIELIDFEVLYNYGEKVLKFQTAPATSSVIAWTGNPLKPIIVQYKDNASITKYGEFQYKIIDKSIKDLDGARQRALQDLKLNAEALEQGSFRTRRNGLRAGQSMNVNSVIRGINRNYTIKSINMRCYGPSANDVQVMFSVSLS